MLNGTLPLELAPGEWVVPTTAELAFDRHLEHFALGVWTQDQNTSEKTTTMLVAVPEPSAVQAALIAVAVLGALAARRPRDSDCRSGSDRLQQSVPASALSRDRVRSRGRS